MFMDTTGSYIAKKRFTYEPTRRGSKTPWKAPKFKSGTGKARDAGRDLARRREARKMVPRRGRLDIEPMKRYELSPEAKRIVAKALVRGGVRLAEKALVNLNPYVRLASYLWDGYDFFNNDPMEWMKTADGGLDMSGFTHCCTTGSEPEVWYRLVYDRPTAVKYAAAKLDPCGFDPVTYPVLCGLNNQVQTGPWPQALTITGYASRTVVTLYTGPSRFAGARMMLQTAYRMTLDDATPYTIPLEQPMVQPLPALSRPPAPVIEDYFGGPEPVADPQLDQPPGRPPYEVPALEFSAANGRRGGEVRPHYNTPPPRHVHERKRVVVKRGPGAAIAGPAFGAVTEGLDLVDALWWSLPGGSRDGNMINPSHRTPYATYPEKLVDIAEGLDFIDWNEALVNFIANEVGDRVGAAISRKVNQPYVKGPASQYWVRPTGPTAGARRNFQNVKVL